jgi:polyisoprenoid-binding protein YceI
MGNWQLDPYHTQVEFSAKHLGMMTVRGHFADVKATADIDPDHPETSSVQVTIQVASLRTNNETRDRDVLSSNFLEVDKYPEMTFVSTGVVPQGGDRFTVNGDLTIKGNTRQVALDMTHLGEFNDPRMGHRIGYTATTTINRQDYGLNFAAMLDGKFVVSDEIKILIEGELVEQQQTADAQAG